MNTKTVIISGSRTIENYDALNYTICTSPWYGRIDTVFVGDAKGVDRMAVRWCKENGISYRIFRADWGFYGKGAGPERNQEMINQGGEALIVLWDGESKGSADMIRRAMKHNLPCHIQQVHNV